MDGARNRWWAQARPSRHETPRWTPVGRPDGRRRWPRLHKAFEDVKRNEPFWMSPDFKYVRHELRDLEITFARSDELAWFYGVLDDINTYKGQPASWENTRWTGVVEKRNGGWVVVQQHFSFASEK